MNGEKNMFSISFNEITLVKFEAMVKVTDIIGEIFILRSNIPASVQNDGRG